MPMDVVSIGGIGGWRWVSVDLVDIGYSVGISGIGGWWWVLGIRWISVDLVGIGGLSGSGLGTGRDAVDPLDRDTSQGIGEIGKRRASRKFKKSENVHFSF